MNRVIELQCVQREGRQICADELKGFAMILLVLFHAGGVLTWNNYLHGDLGTDIFLIVSGACLALTQADAPARDFLKRRLLRIFPTYWLAYTLFLVLQGWIWGRYCTPGSIVAHYFSLHGFFGDAWAFAVNDSFWFITALLVYYACFLLFRPLLPRLDLFWLAAASVSAAGALTIFFSGQGALMGRWGFRMPDFFIGMMLGHGLREGRLRLPLTPWLGVALLLLLYLPYTRGIVYHPGLVALGLAVAYVVLLRPLLRLLAVGRGVKRILAFMGRHSLEIFLLHQPLMRDYNRHVQARWFGVTEPTDLQLIAGMVVAVAVTVFLAWGLHAVWRRAAAVLLGRLDAPAAVAPGANAG